MTIKATVLAISMATLFSASAHADLLYAGPSADQATDSSIVLDFNSATAKNTTLSFTIDGYLSLDGQNYYEDDFSLNLNGSTIFVGTFNLGGGSNSGQQANVYDNPYGATYSNPTGNGTGIGWNGGKEDISFADVPTIAGTNVLTFAYFSLEQGHAGFQGLGDEGWGIQNVRVGSVPEPATWGMMLIGFASLGFAGYRSSRRTVSIID